MAFASSEQGRRFVAISDAMVQTLGTPESVSALLAHELTHIENGDRVPERYGNATALDALRKVGKERRQEALADYRPLALLDAAGIDPYALVRAFERTIEPGTSDPGHGSRDDRIANAIEVFNFIAFVHIGKGETTFNWPDNAFAQYRCLADYHEHSGSLHPIEQGQYIIKWRNELIRKQMSQGKNSPLYNQEWQAFVSYVQQTLMFHSSELTKETVCYPMMAVLQGNQRIQDTLTSSLEEQDEQTVLTAFDQVAQAKKVLDLVGLSEYRDTTYDPKTFSAIVSAYLGKGYKGNPVEWYKPVVDRIAQHQGEKEGLLYPVIVDMIQNDLFSKKFPQLGNILEHVNPDAIQNMLYTLARSSVKDELDFSARLHTTLGLEHAQLVINRITVDGDVPFLPDDQIGAERQRQIQEQAQDALTSAYFIELDDRRFPSKPIYAHLRKTMSRLYKKRLGNAQEMTPQEIVQNWHIIDDLIKPNIGKIDSEVRNKLPAQVRIIDTKLRDFFVNVPEVLDWYESICRQGDMQEIQTARGVMDRYVKTLYTASLPSRERSYRDYENHMRTEHAARPFKKTLLTQDMTSLYALLSNQKSDYLDRVCTSYPFMSSVINATSVKDMLRIAETIISAPGVSLTYSDIANPAFMEKIRALALKEAMGAGNMQPLVDTVDRFPIYNVRDIQAGKGKGKLDAYEHWNTLFDRIMESDEPNIHDLVILSLTSSDLSIQQTILPRALKRMAETMQFDDIIDLIETRWAHLPPHIFADVVTYLSEERATSLTQFDQINAIVERTARDFLQNETAVGAVALGQAVYDQVRGLQVRTSTDPYNRMTLSLDPAELFAAVLDTRHGNDKPLREIIARAWWAYYGERSLVNRLFTLTKTDAHTRADPNIKNQKLMAFLMEDPPQGRKPFTEWMDSLYGSVSPASKRVLLRGLLIGQKGLISHDPEKLIDIISTRYIRSDNTEERETIQTLVRALISEGDPNFIYMLMVNLFSDDMLRIPENPTSYREMATYLANELLALYADSGDFTVTDRERELLTAKLVVLMTARKSKDEIDQIDKAPTDPRSPLARLSAIFGQDTAPQQQPMGGLELAQFVAEHVPFLGPRALQLATIYYGKQIPPQFRDQWASSFDAVTSHSRLQAVRTLRYYAQWYPQVAALLGQIESLSPIQSAGSLVAGMEATMKDGSRRFLGVAGTNAHWQIEQIGTLFQQALDRSAQTNPHNNLYQVLGTIMQHIRDGSRRELQDPRYHEEDSVFAQALAGVYTPGFTDIRMRITDSEDLGSGTIRLEQYVPGVNLTGLRIGEVTDLSQRTVTNEDMKHIAAEVIRYGVWQVLAPGSRFSHSDAHPGNLRVAMEEGQIVVYWLDRRNKAEISDEDKRLFMRLLFSAVTEGSTERIISEVFSHVMALQENSHLLSNQNKILHHVLAQYADNSQMDQLFMRCFVALSQRGVHIPDHYLSIMKNIRSFDNLAKDAGFPGLGHALLHHFSVSDLWSYVSRDQLAELDQMAKQQGHGNIYDAVKNSRVIQENLQRLPDQIRLFLGVPAVDPDSQEQPPPQAVRIEIDENTS